MINSFIHFNDLALQSIELHLYKDGLADSKKILEFNDIQSSLEGSANVYALLPSQLFGFKHYENSQGLKGEILKAHVLSEIEDQLIADISTLEFFYDPDLKLASWIDSDLYDAVADGLNKIDAAIYLLPEHFLIPEKENTIFVTNKNFMVSYSDGSGFGGSFGSLNEYLRVLELNNINLRSLKVLKENDSVKDKSLNLATAKLLPLEELHLGIIKKTYLINFNYFRRKISFRFLRSKLKLTSLESGLIAASILIILFTPMMINLALNSAVTQHQENTISIFKQLNPNFRRLVNPQAQIDDLTRNIPTQVSITKQNLDVMQYIEKLNDESVKNIMIDLMQSSLNITIEGLPAYKLTVLKEILKQEPISFNDSSLVEKSNALYGNLIIAYDAK